MPHENLSTKDLINRHRKSQSTRSLIEAHKSSLKEKTPNMSQTEASIRGAAQGALFGFPDELEGLGRAAYDWIESDPKSFIENYRHHRDEAQRKYEQAEREHPGTYGTSLMAGAIAPALVSGGASAPATIARMAVHGAAQGLGSTKADLTRGEVLPAIADTALGGLGSVVVGKSIQQIPKVASAVGSRFGNLKQLSNRLGTNATGATPTEKGAFKPDTGTELIKRKLIRFGDTARDILPRVSDAVKQSGTKIEDALEYLDKHGGQVKLNTIVARINGQIRNFKGNESKQDVIRSLERIKENISSIRSKLVDQHPTQHARPLSATEEVKRGFDRVSTNWTDPHASEADKIAYRIYKEAVEDAVDDTYKHLVDKTAKAIVHKQKMLSVTTPDNANLYRQRGFSVDRAKKAHEDVISRNIPEEFKSAKESFGLLAPVEDALKGKVNRMDQIPLVSASDLPSMVAGTLFGGPKGTVAAWATKRIIAPRMSSSTAVMADHLSEVLKFSPQKLGKYADPLMKAAARGPQSLAAANFILQQTQPEYRKLVLEPHGEDSDQEEEYNP